VDELLAALALYTSHVRQRQCLAPHARPLSEAVTLAARAAAADPQCGCLLPEHTQLASFTGTKVQILTQVRVSSGIAGHAPLAATTSTATPAAPTALERVRAASGASHGPHAWVGACKAGVVWKEVEGGRGDAARGEGVRGGDVTTRRAGGGGGGGEERPESRERDGWWGGNHEGDLGGGVNVWESWGGKSYGNVRDGMDVGRGWGCHALGGGEDWAVGWLQGR
jgi:hypothetical protein